MRRRLLRWARLALFALVPLVVLVVGLEAALWGLGLGDPDDSLSLSRGFDPRARYLVPVEGRPGAFVTQMFDGSSPEVSIPPKDDRVRVVLFGGSNVQGFPDRWLEQRLHAAAPEPGFEVVNLGRQGYGSERVGILVRQAQALRPDIVLIYTGHNEFVEAGFLLELRRQWHDPRLMRLGAAIGRLRTLNLLSAALAPPPGAPEPRSRRAYVEYREFDYEHALMAYDLYRENLRAMCRTALGYGAEVVVGTVVSNDVDPPTVASLGPGLDGATRTRVKSLNAQALAAVPERFARGVLQRSAGDEPLRPRPNDWGESMTPEQRAARRAEREAEERAGGTVREPPSLRPLGGDFAEGPFWLDATLWSPAVRELMATMAAFHARRLAPSEREALAGAVARLEEAVALSPDHPASLFHLAWCLWLTGGDDARAARLFREAARYDRAPTHGNDLTNGIVREVAAGLPGVVLVDAEERVRACCPDGLVGFELMIDSCHLHAPAKPLLMEAFVPALLEAGERVVARR